MLGQTWYDKVQFHTNLVIIPYLQTGCGVLTGVHWLANLIENIILYIYTLYIKQSSYNIFIIYRNNY